MARRTIERLVDFGEGEFGPAVLSALYFFCLLFGYFMLRPLRDAMGLDGGVDSLRVLFMVTLGVMVVANIGFGWVASRVPRRVFVPLVYWVGIGCLAVFLGLFLVLGEGRSPLVGNVFYVWLSVFNLFAVTVFWGFMADVFSLEQGKRLFGFIGVGGTAGAMCGSAFTGALSGWLGEVGLFACAMVLIGAAGMLATALSRRADARIGARVGGLGGAGWSGLVAVVRSPYLLGIASYVGLYTVLSTLVYFEKAAVVERFSDSREARASVLAWIEMGGQGLTLLIQLLLTGRFMRRFGVGTLLAVVPTVTLAGFAALAAAPGLVTIGVLDAVRRAGNFALSKPARETLFTVLPRDEKYKAKSAIDTFVYRGGDTVGTLLNKAASVSAVGGVFVAAPLCVAGVALSAYLGVRERKRAEGETHDSSVPAGDGIATPAIGGATA